MRRDDPGAGAGMMTDPGLPAPRPAGARLSSGAAGQIAELVARAARAPTGLIYFIEGDRLHLSGEFGLIGRREEAESRPIEDSLAAPVVAGGEPLVIEDLARSGSRVAGIHGAFLCHPVRDETGGVIGICCAYDTAPRRWSPEQIAAVATAAQVSTLVIAEQRARREVDRQRRFLDAVLDSLHDGVTACDTDGRVVLTNTRMREMWAGDENELTDAEGRPLDCAGLPLFRALDGERLRDEEMTRAGSGGPARHYVVDAQPIVGPDGQVIGAVQAVQDVTRRRRAARFRTCELRVTTALAEAPSIEAAGPRVLEAVVDTLDWTHAELWLVDDTAGVLRPAARFSAKGWADDIATPSDLPYGQGLAGRVWQVGKPLWIRDVGRPQSLISSETAASSRLRTALALPVRHGTEPLGVLAVFANTVQDPEEELVALLSGVAAHLAQFVDRRLVEDLQRQLVQSKNEYLALVGHELRTPLTSISAYSEILGDLAPDALATDGPALVEVIDRNTAKLRRIIDELLELSALDAGHAAVTVAPVDLADVVRESVRRTTEAIGDAPLEVVTDLPEKLVLPGDRRRLQQVVDNLLGNAVKYSPDGGRISVVLAEVGRAAELTISDTGIGVAPEEREKLFARLYRSSTVRDKAIPGTGLGLALSRAVVHRHHGTIELPEHDGPGTTVLVRLPLEPR